MNKYSKLIAVMAALAAGSALAAGGTSAGTQISNTATATFNDATGTAQTPIDSNTVTTTVSAVPTFTITPNDSSADLGPHPATPGQSQTNTLPGATVDFPYTVTNTGNTPVQVTLSTLYSVNGALSTTSGITGVQYFVDTNGNGVLDGTEGATAVTSVVVANNTTGNATVKLIQRYVVPATGANSANGTKLGADPVGSGTYDPAGATGTSYTSTVAIAGTTAPYLNQDANNFNQVTLSRTDAGKVGPNTDADADGKLDPANTTAVTPYTQGGVTINYNGDSQNAQATTTSTSVTFKNSVVNNGNRPDIFDLTAALSNAPTGATVTISSDAAGTSPITKTPTVNPGLAGEYTFYVTVTYPAGSVPTSPTAPFTATVTSTSENSLTTNGGTGTGGTDTTTNIVNLPSVQFTDSVNGTPTPGTPNNTVTTTGAATGTTPTTFPMVVKNNGTAPDTFSLTGTVNITTPTGTTATPVTYYADANCDGVADNTTAITSTGALAAGATYCVVAQVNVPQNTLPGTYTLTQTATSATTGATSTDNNDKFTVQITANSYKPAKTVDLTNAAPGATLTYTIAASNTNNSNLTNYILKDTVPTNTTFASVTASITDTNAYGTTGYKLLYRFNGGAWQTSTTPTTAPTAGQLVEIGIDTNNDNTISTLDILKPGQGITETFKVTVN